MFIALLFLPLMRWLGKKNIPKIISIFIVVLLVAGLLKIGGELIQLTSKEILATDGVFFEKAETKLLKLATTAQDFLGIKYLQENSSLVYYLQKENIIKNFGVIIDFVGNTLSMVLITAFFVVLWLAESINFQKLLNNTILKRKYSSIKTFIKIEKDILTFMKVKFLMSLFTGIGIGLACVFFDVSFPVFWGLFAFAINFIQMVGSFVVVILLSLFAFIELDPTNILLFFVITIIAVQVLFGGILEPVFMGKSFSINIITILVMLMLWGYLWGIPGLIMAIPITVFMKIIFEQFPRTKFIANLISGDK